MAANLKVRLNDTFIGYISNIKTENSTERSTTQTFSGDVANPSKTPSRKVTLTRLEVYQAATDQKTASSIEIEEAIEDATNRSDNAVQVINNVNDLTKREMFTMATLDSDNTTYDPANPEQSEIVFTAKGYKRTIT